VAKYYGLPDLAAEGKDAEIKKHVQTHLRDASTGDDCIRETFLEIFFTGSASWGREYRHHFNDGFTQEVLAFVVTLVSVTTSTVFRKFICILDPFGIGGVGGGYDENNTFFTGIL